MTDTPQRRDYSLTGPENARSVAEGLANADWYHTAIPRARLKELMRRDDGPATRDTIVWLGSLVVLGALGAYFWGSWACAPFFLVYGVLYGSAGDSRWHECGHGTAFRTVWKNKAVYEIACFLMIRNPVIWRWSHARHHSDTIIVGRDPEIITPRPPKIGLLLLNLFGLVEAPEALFNMVRYASGSLTADEKDFVPEAEQPKVAASARVWVAIYRRRHRRVLCHALDPAGDADRVAPLLRLLAHGADGADAAHRACRGRSRPSAQRAHRLHESVQPLRVLEYELSCRAPHVSDGALSHAADVA